MVQFNPNLNVGQTFQLKSTSQVNSTPQVTETDSANDSTKGPTAEKSAVYRSMTSFWRGGSWQRSIVLPREIQPGDILQCFDANLRFLGFDENGYGVYEEVDYVSIAEYDPNRGDPLVRLK